MVKEIFIPKAIRYVFENNGKRAASYGVQKKAGLWRCCTAGFGLCICACFSDWAENVCMITVLANYPAKAIAAAAAARISTALKYAVMIALIALIVYMFIKVRKRISG